MIRQIVVASPSLSIYQRTQKDAENREHCFYRYVFRGTLRNAEIDKAGRICLPQFIVIQKHAKDAENGDHCFYLHAFIDTFKEATQRNKEIDEADRICVS